VNVREPVVAGHFYPGGRSALLRTVEKFLPPEGPREKAFGVAAPHAGYVYSGATAGAVLGSVAVPETVILFGPNHTGYGEPYAVAAHDAWRTPLGETPVDADMRARLLAASRYLESDAVAHAREHSIEVMLPFLQVLRADVKIVPVALSGYPENPAWFEIGEAAAEAVSGSGREALIVASTDMTHYEDEKTAEEKDLYAVDAMLALDESALAQRIAEREISMCGHGPVIAAIVACRALGATRGRLVEYTTSGRVSGDRAQVVGYAGVVFE